MPPQPPAQPPESIILSKWKGLTNTVSRERLDPDDLARAVNVDVDDASQLRRRRGYANVATGSYHSLFNADDGTVYGVKDGELVIVNPDYSIVQLGRTIGNPIITAQVGPTIYYTGSTDAGKIDTRTLVVSDWGNGQDLWLSPVVNPTANLAAIKGKLLGKPPLASCMTLWHGRLYLANGPLVWATELYLYDYVDKTRTFFQYEGDVTMLGTVGDGYYVGTTEGLWFCQGDFPQKRQRVMDSPVIPGSMTYVPAELANPPQVQPNADTPMKVSIVFMTTSGFCVAMENGEAYNLTENKFEFPTASSMASFYRRQDGINQYIGVAQNGGDPQNAARSGDYIDAEIVRFSAV